MENLDSWVLDSSHSLFSSTDHPNVFSASRGLRQGDPLSSFLFTLVANAFSQILSEGAKPFKGFRVGKQHIPLTFTICG